MPTPYFGFPFPDGDSAPDGPTAVSNLAQAVEDSLRPKPVVTDLLELQASAGWSMVAFWFRQTASSAMVRIRVQRTGATISLDAKGLPSSTVSICTIVDPAKRPIELAAMSSVTSRIASATIDTDGVVRFRAAGTTQAVGTNDVLDFQGQIDLP